MFSERVTRRESCQPFLLPGNTSLRRREFALAFEPYRKAFTSGSVHQQTAIINLLVDTLISAETERLKEELPGTTEKFELEEIFTCELCERLFHDPVTLVCGHTFCSNCLQRYLGSTTCLVCGHSSTLEYTMNIVLRELLGLWFPEKIKLRQKIEEANLLLHDTKMREFDELIEKLMVEYPKIAELYYLRAIGHKRRGNIHNALKDLNVAVSLSPFSSKVLFCRAQVLESFDEQEETTAMYLRASALKPNNCVYRSVLTAYLEILLRNICLNPHSGSPQERKAVNKRVMKSFESTIPLRSFDKLTSSRRNLHEKMETVSRSNSFAQEGHESVLYREERMEESLTKDEYLRSTKVYQQDTKTNISTNEKANCTIPSEIECKLCYNLMYQAVSTPCGHSFCQSCLRRCLDHRMECPCCRANLNSYLEHLLNGKVGTCAVIDNIVKLKFPTEYQERKANYEKEMSRFSRCDINDNEIPIFVCTFAVPGIACPLHIFEPRYKLMIRRCLESGSRQFGMCVPDPESGFSTVGTMLYINDAKFLPDGRSIAQTVGNRRFEVLERGVRDGYNTAKVKWLEDVRDEVDSSQLNHEVYKLMLLWFKTLPREQQMCIVKAVGPMPQALSATDTNGPNWLWWVLAAIPLNVEAKLIILSMVSVRERLSSIKRFLVLLLTRT